MPSFGEKLKLEREKRKITLEQISASTKIGTRMLQSLEEDKFNQLPGGIFNKGFVRAYSRCIGLDEDQTVADYLQASGDAPPVSTEIVPREDVERENEENVRRLEAVTDDYSRRPLPWGLLAAILLLIALALSFWSYRRKENTKPLVNQNPVRTPTMAAATMASHPTTAQSRTTESQMAGQASSSVPTSSVPKTEGSAPRSPAAATSGDFTVVIHAREDSWISITADGKTSLSEILATGTERAIQGRKEVTVKIGNAGGVELRFNGQKVAAGGEFGEVRTVTFGPKGMVPNASEPSSRP